MFPDFQHSDTELLWLTGSRLPSLALTSEHPQFTHLYLANKSSWGINPLRNMRPHDLVNRFLAQTQLQRFLDPSVHAADVVLADRGFPRVSLVDVE